METNFKVDVPSFALGYSAGAKKVPPSQEKEVIINSNGTTEVLPDDGKLLSKVTVNTAVNGGLNIHYSETDPPEDTSMLWVKSSGATVVDVKKEMAISAMDEVLPMRRSKMGQATIGNTLYLIGGYDDTSESTGYGTRDIYAFDLVTRKCEKLPVTIPVYMYSAACAAVGTEIYIFGGMGAESKWSSFNALKTIYLFDTVKMTIAKLDTTMNYGVSSMATAVIDSQIYLFGGSNYDNGLNAVTYAFCFDTEERTIRSIASLANTRMRIGATVHNGLIYLLGGYASSVYRYVQVYHPDTNTYDKVETTALPIGYGNGNGFARIGTKLYLPAGQTSGSGLPARLSNKIGVYDLDTKQGYAAEFVTPYKFEAAACACINDEIYLLGGTITDESAQYGYAPANKITKIPTDFPLEKNLLWLKCEDGDHNVAFDCLGSFKITTRVTKAYKGNEQNVGEPVEMAVYKNEEWTAI